MKTNSQLRGFFLFLHLLQSDCDVQNFDDGVLQKAEDLTMSCSMDIWTSADSLSCSMVDRRGEKLLSPDATVTGTVNISCQSNAQVGVKFDHVVVVQIVDKSKGSRLMCSSLRLYHLLRHFSFLSNHKLITNAIKFKYEFQTLLDASNRVIYHGKENFLLKNSSSVKTSSSCCDSYWNCRLGFAHSHDSFCYGSGICLCG